MFIEPGTKIIRGVKVKHECTEEQYYYKDIRGTLVDNHGRKIEYNMKKCDKCGVIAMRGDKVDQIKYRHPDYEFVFIAKPKKPGKAPSKKQIRNAQYLTACAVADAQGLPRPKKKGKQEKPSKDTPDYVFRGEAPSYMQHNARFPFQGGSMQ